MSQDVPCYQFSSDAGHSNGRFADNQRRGWRARATQPHPKASCAVGSYVLSAQIALKELQTHLEHSRCGQLLCQNFVVQFAPRKTTHSHYIVSFYRANIWHVLGEKTQIRFRLSGRLRGSESQGCGFCRVVGPQVSTSCTGGICDCVVITLEYSWCFLFKWQGKQVSCEASALISFQLWWSHHILLLITIIIYHVMS